MRRDRSKLARHAKSISLRLAQPRCYSVTAQEYLKTFSKLPRRNRHSCAGRACPRESGGTPTLPVQLCRPANPDTAPLPHRRRLRYRLPMEDANIRRDRSIRYGHPDRPPVFSLSPSSLSDFGYAKGVSAGKMQEFFVLNLKCDTPPTKPMGNNLRRSYGRIMDKSKRMAGAVIPAEGVDTQPPARHVGLNRHARLKRTCCTS